MIMSKKKMIKVMNKLNAITWQMNRFRRQKADREIMLKLVNKYNRYWAMYKRQTEYKMVWNSNFACYTDVVKARGNN